MARRHYRRSARFANQLLVNRCAGRSRPIQLTKNSDGSSSFSLPPGEGAGSSPVALQGVKAAKSAYERFGFDSDMTALCASLGRQTLNLAGSVWGPRWSLNWQPRKRRGRGRASTSNYLRIDKRFTTTDWIVGGPVAIGVGATFGCGCGEPIGPSSVATAWRCTESAK